MTTVEPRKELYQLFLVTAGDKPALTFKRAWDDLISPMIPDRGGQCP